MICCSTGFRKVRCILQTGQGRWNPIFFLIVELLRLSRRTSHEFNTSLNFTRFLQSPLYLYKVMLKHVSCFTFILNKYHRCWVVSRRWSFLWFQKFLIFHISFEYGQRSSFIVIVITSHKLKFDCFNSIDNELIFLSNFPSLSFFCCDHCHLLNLWWLCRFLNNF